MKLHLNCNLQMSTSKHRTTEKTTGHATGTRTTAGKRAKVAGTTEKVAATTATVATSTATVAEQIDRIDLEHGRHSVT
jgi:hypothetical protein